MESKKDINITLGAYKYVFLNKKDELINKYISPNYIEFKPNIPIVINGLSMLVVGVEHRIDEIRDDSSLLTIVVKTTSL